MNILYVVVHGAGKWFVDWSLTSPHKTCSECFWLVPGTWEWEDEL